MTPSTLKTTKENFFRFAAAILENGGNAKEGSRTIQIYQNSQIWSANNGVKTTSRLLPPYWKNGWNRLQGPQAVQISREMTQSTLKTIKGNYFRFTAAILENGGNAQERSRTFQTYQIFQNWSVNNGVKTTSGLRPPSWKMAEMDNGENWQQ